MISLDFSTVVTIVYVAILYFFLSRYFFGPIQRVLAERRAAIDGTLAEAGRRIEEVEKKTGEYEAVVREARSEAYRQQEAVRDGALEERARLLAETRREADAIIADARQRLGAEADQARERLENDIDALAERLSRSLLQDDKIA